jgi:hypothetical protein
MQYVTPAQLLIRLRSDSSFDQPTSDEYDALLDDACTNATAIVNSYIGDGQPFAFQTLGTADAPDARVFTGDGTIALPLDLPLQQFVSADNGGMAELPDGVWLEPANASLKGSIVLKPEADGSQFGWDTARQSVIVRGVWGWGDVPADVIEVVLELAVRIVKGRAAGYSDVIGIDAEGASDSTTAYVKALPALAKLALDLQRTRVRQFRSTPASPDFGWFGVA